MKTCRDCKVEKSTNEFIKNSGCKDGFRPECKECCKEWKKQHYLKNRDKIIKDTSLWAKNNRIKRQEICRKSYAKHIAKERARSLAYAKRKPWVRNANCAKRRATLSKVTPKWLSQKELKEIAEFYKNCPKGYEVDHIIPISGKLATGFHVISNLQYLKIKENRSKSNKFTPIINSQAS